MSALATVSALAVPELPASDPTLLTAIVRAVNSDRMFTDLDFLSSGLKTRSSKTAQFDAACQYALEALRSMGLSVSLDPFSGDGHAMTNVVAVKPGTVYPSQIVVIGAHLDSTSPTPATLAPGAEDNGSGSVAVLEAARLLASLPSERTIHFILFGGEEQDMLGSAHYAAQAVSRNLDIRAVLTMDMIGYHDPRGADLWIEGFHRGTSSVWLMNQLDVNARTYGGLKTSLYPGEGSDSDHEPFHDQGFPAVLAIENEWGSYACYHETCDTVDKLDAGLMRRIAWSVIATAAELAGVTTALGQINGTVRMAGGGSPAGAVVALSGTSRSPITLDVSGRFAFPNLLPADYAVTVAWTGYPPTTAAVAVSAGSIKNVSINVLAAPAGTPAPTPTPPPSPGTGAACSGCTGSAPGSGWICVNAGWVPPGHPLAAACSVTGGGTPAPTPTPTPPLSPGTVSACGGCTGSAPGSGWICVNAGWVPPGHPLAATCSVTGGGTPAPTPTPTPPLSPGTGTACSGCTGRAPGSGWICVNAGWVPPGHPLAATCSVAGGGTPAPTPTPAPPPSPGTGAACSGCTGSAPGSGWICVNGGWVPPGHPLAAACSPALVGSRSADTSTDRLRSGGSSSSAAGDAARGSQPPADPATYATVTVTVECVVRPVRSDITGDGTPDVVVRDADTGDVYVWVLATGTPVRAGWVGQMADPAWRLVATGDFNTDGHVDLVWRHADSGQHRVWFLDRGVHRGTQALEPWPNLAWRIVDAGDVNADGHDDVVWEDPESGQHGVWFLRGVTYVGSAALSTPTTGQAAAADERWAVAGVDDVDADGRVDLVWRNTATGQILIGHMDGVAAVASPWAIQLPDLNWAVVLVADFNGDGYADLLWRDDTSGAMGIWYRNGLSVLGLQGPH